MIKVDVFIKNKNWKKKISNPNSLKGLKEIISIADNHSCFDKSIFNTILWASEYYHHPIGEVFFSFIISFLFFFLPIAFSKIPLRVAPDFVAPSPNLAINDFSSSI